jgi:UDP-N-acetylglucosamine 2-epimerase (non-hydrolysing)
MAAYNIPINFTFYSKEGWMALVDVVAGARPNFMKIAPIIDAIRQRPETGLRYRLIHTGQHYDKRMSGDFFDQLGIPEPDYNLEVGSGTQAEQTAAIMIRYEKLLMASPADLCLVVGDVTSTMACSIAAQKLCIPVAHVEGGIRSGDWSMPEEINRMVTDAITNFFFTTSEYANTNLRKAGVAEDRIFFVGNTMIDTLLRQMPRFQPPALWAEERLDESRYIVVTLHRPANVDAPEKLHALIDAIVSGSQDAKLVFPVHPRTRKTLAALGLDRPGVAEGRLVLCEPLPYLEFNYLVKNALAVITDSGGITEEATVMGVPCMTLRDTTERPETVAIGTNELVGTDPAALRPYLDRLFSGKWKTGAIPELWDGQAAERIVDFLARLL